MKVWLLTAPDADYDQHEAWVVIAPTRESAWEIVREGGYEIPAHFEFPDFPMMHPATLREMSPGDGVNIEELGQSREAAPRVAFAAFRAG